VGWVAGDEVYGGNPKLRSALEERKVGYVLAVACSAEVTTGAGKFRADALAAKVPRRAWQKLSAGAGAKGHRFYDWAVIDLAEPRPGSHRLLVRRNRTTGELAYYRCFSPAPAPLATLVRVAGSRWRVEETFQAGKGLVRLTATVTPDGDWYVARCLDVEVASQGPTIDEALANLREALELYFEDEPVSRPSRSGSLHES
jgi:predicted RNase H-like HicB family nuclease